MQRRGLGRVLLVSLVWVFLLSGLRGQDADTPIRISGGVMAGQIVPESKVQPVYPEAARQKHIQGAVVFAVVIGREGGVESLQVISGPEVLRGPCEDAIRQWRYKPYFLNGVARRVQTTVTLNLVEGSKSN